MRVHYILNPVRVLFFRCLWGIPRENELGILITLNKKEHWKKKLGRLKLKKFMSKKYLLLVVQYFTFVYYSFKIFSCLWLARSPQPILHNQFWPNLEDASNRMVYWLGNEVDRWYICRGTRLHRQTDHLSTSFPGAAPRYLFTCELINMAFTAIR